MESYTLYYFGLVTILCVNDSSKRQLRSKVDIIPYSDITVVIRACRYKGPLCTNVYKIDRTIMEASVENIEADFLSLSFKLSDLSLIVRLVNFKLLLHQNKCYSSYKWQCDYS